MQKLRKKRKYEDMMCVVGVTGGGRGGETPLYGLARKGVVSEGLHP